MKIKYQGRDIDTTEIEVLTSDEQWSTFQLSDGKVLMYKEVLVSILRLEGELNPDGSQVYQLQTHKVVRIK